MNVYEMGPYIITGCTECGEIVRSTGKNSDALMEMMVMHFRFHPKCRSNFSFDDFFEGYEDFANPQKLKFIIEEDKKEVADG